jgi:hypothetical protein
VNPRQRRHARDGERVIRRQRVREHGVAPADVVAQQRGEAGRIGRAAGPAQQRHEPRVAAAVRRGAVGLREARGQAGGADRAVGRLAHGEVADEGQGLDRLFDGDGVVDLHSVTVVTMTGSRKPRLVFRQAPGSVDRPILAPGPILYTGFHRQPNNEPLKEPS